MRLNRTNAPRLIVDEAVRQAEAVGYSNLTIRQVAEGFGYTQAWVNRYYTAAELQDAVVRRAIDTRNLKVIGQAIAASHAFVADLPADLRREAVEALL